MTTVTYKRARFGTRLPADRLYTRSHYWLQEAEPGIWRVGFTKFATRMLGDLVEYQFESQPGDAIGTGRKLGWIEGFKAVSDIYSVVNGTFGSANANLGEDITLLESDPYERGWLYAASGSPEPEAMDVHGYVAVLDATITKMLESRHDNPEGRSDE